jgi:hypothetical protein
MKAKRNETGEHSHPPPQEPHDGYFVHATGPAHEWGGQGQGSDNTQTWVSGRTALAGKHPHDVNIKTKT